MRRLNPMTWQDMVAGVKEEFLGSKHTQNIALSLAALLVLVGGYLGYRWYVQQREERAQLVFAAAVDLAQQALKSESDQQAGSVTWQDVEMAFKIGYDQNKSSYLAPYFLAFQAEALLRQRRQEEALSLMNEVLSQLSTSDQLYDQYFLKRACIKLDSTDEQIKKQGLDELTSIADKADSLFKEPAEYYLGEYYWANQQFDKARDTWLALTAENTKGEPSVWKEAAIAKLNQF